jgi:hypothetical protein
VKNQWKLSKKNNENQVKKKQWKLSEKKPMKNEWKISMKNILKLSRKTSKKAEKKLLNWLIFRWYMCEFFTCFMAKFQGICGWNFSNFPLLIQFFFTHYGYWSSHALDFTVMVVEYKYKLAHGTRDKPRGITSPSFQGLKMLSLVWEGH